MSTTKEQIMAKVAVDVVSGCWLWSGTISDKGYGRIWINERRASVYAHRISYELHREAIPAGLVLALKFLGMLVPE